MFGNIYGNMRSEFESVLNHIKSKKTPFTVKTISDNVYVSEDNVDRFIEFLFREGYLNSNFYGSTVGTGTLLYSKTEKFNQISNDEVIETYLEISKHL